MPSIHGSIKSENAWNLDALEIIRIFLDDHRRANTGVWESSAGIFGTGQWAFSQTSEL